MSLLKAIKDNKPLEFSNILWMKGWPQDNEYSDYLLLTKAMTLGNKEIVNILLERGCRINRAVINRTNTPLHLAASKLQDLGIINRLLALGARILEKNRDGDTPLHIAFSNNASGRIIDLLMDHCCAVSWDTVANKKGLTFLHIACTRPRLHVVQEFIRTGHAHVNCQVSFDSDDVCSGYTPLHFAVENGLLDIAELLLYYGADIYIKDAHGSTALHMATELRDIAMIDLLLKFDTKKRDCANRFGLTHFMAACMSTNTMSVCDFIRQVELLKVPWAVATSKLINGKVRGTEMYPFSGYTPLHFAAQYGRKEVVEILLDIGAFCCVLNASKQTALYLAHKYSNYEIIEMIKNHCVGYKMLNSALPESPKLHCGTRWISVTDEENLGTEDDFRSWRGYEKMEVVLPCESDSCSSYKETYVCSVDSYIPEANEKKSSSNSDLSYDFQMHTVGTNYSENSKTMLHRMEVTKDVQLPSTLYKNSNFESPIPSHDFADVRSLESKLFKRLFDPSKFLNFNFSASAENIQQNSTTNQINLTSYRANVCVDYRISKEDSLIIDLDSNENPKFSIINLHVGPEDITIN